MDEVERFQAEIFATRGQYLVAGKSCNAQAGLNNIVESKGGSPGYLFITNEPETGRLHVPQGLHHFIFYLSEKAKHCGYHKAEVCDAPSILYARWSWINTA